MTSCFGSHVLFGDGQSAYCIVPDKDAPASEKYAAEELQYLLKDAQKPDCSDDSFTWCSKGGDLLFWGGCERGTLYAVYDFLEDQLGCRWYSSKVSLAPKQAAWSFKKLYEHEVPGIIARDNCIYGVRHNPAFSARVRNNFVRLQRGMHRFSLRYFDDCEGQKLEVQIHAPNGYEGPLPVEICYLPE